MGHLICESNSRQDEMLVFAPKETKASSSQIAEQAAVPTHEDVLYEGDADILSYEQQNQEHDPESRR